MSEMYTDLLLDHCRHPRNEGQLDAPDLAAEEYNPLCGDRVTIEAKVAAGRIVEVRFRGRGCDQAVSHIGAWRNSSNDKTSSGAIIRGQILHAVHGQVRFACK